MELNDPSALLCNGCERKAINISNMSEKLERLKVEVKSSLSRLHVASSSRKRPSLPLDMPSDLEPAPKRSHTGTQARLHSIMSEEPAQCTSISSSPDIQVIFPHKLVSMTVLILYTLTVTVMHCCDLIGHRSRQIYW